MHVSTDRFDLDESDEKGIERFEDYIWTNSEVCNHCFTRVREVERNQTARNLSDSSLRNLPADFHERTDQGTQEFTPFDYNIRYGTCFCLECGGDLTASHQDMTLDQMKEFSKNLFRYTRKHTPLFMNGKRLGVELGQLKSRRDTQGRESQMFAVAFARATSLNSRPADRPIPAATA